ncbi:MAG TPA: chloride channel protein [Blastocatellia bacterium]
MPSPHRSVPDHITRVHPAAVPPSAGGTSQPANLSFGTHILLRILLPALIGALSGVLVAAATWLTTDHGLGLLAQLPRSWPALFSPLALLVTLGVATWVTRTTKPSTSELYIVTYYSPDGRLPLRQIPGRVLGAMTTIVFGGSQGLESASALIGAGLGNFAGLRWLRHIPEDERRTLLACGASAGIGAVFSSPAIGTLYGIEIPFRRDVDGRRLVPCAVAAATAFIVRAALIGSHHLVVMDGVPKVDRVFVAGVVLIALACGIGGRLFALAGEGLKHLASHETRHFRAIGAGLVLAVLAWGGHHISGHWVTFGPGYIAADSLLNGSTTLWVLSAVLLIRCAGTLSCVYGGGGGGVFTSLACAGAFVGQIVAVVLHRTESHVFPFIGEACFLGSGYRIPLACILLVCEQSNAMPVVVGGIAALAIGQVLMGPDSVSDAKHRDRMD